MQKYILLIIIPVLIISCEKPENTKDIHADDFAIYEVKVDSLEQAREIQEMDLNLLELEKQPYLNLSDIEFYDSSSNIFYLKYPTHDEDLDFINVPIYYVVVVGRYRQNLLVDWPLVFSSLPLVPRVLTFGYARDIFAIGEGFFDGGISGNMIETEKMIHVLKNSGKLKNGLTANLISLHLLGDKVAVSLELKNYESKSLYVFDPAKMNALQKYAYFGNLHFWDGEKNIYSSLTDSELLDYSESFDNSYLLEIKSMQSDTINFTIEGFEGLPAGTYDCSYFYNMPVNIPEEFRSLLNGRIWLGSKTTSLLSYNLN